MWLRAKRQQRRKQRAPTQLVERTRLRPFSATRLQAGWLSCLLVSAPTSDTAPLDTAPLGFTSVAAALQRGDSTSACDLLLARVAEGGEVHWTRGHSAAAHVVAAEWLAQWPAGARAVWSERAQTAAASRLATAGQAEAAWSEIERLYPATEAAVRAALLLADVAWECGETRRAHSWLERAQLHGASPERLRTRTQALVAETLAAESATTPWHLTTVLERTVQGPAWQGGAGVECDDGSVLVQHGDWLLHASERQENWTLTEIPLTRRCAAELARLGVDEPAVPAQGARTAPAFTQCAGSAKRLVAAVGRARASTGNALVALDLSGTTPRCVWSVGPAGLLSPERTLSPWPGELAGSVLEHSATPFCSGDTVWNLARAWRGSVDETRTEAWLLELSLHDGRLRSARRIATGAISRAQTRLPNDVQPVEAAPPPAPPAGARLSATRLYYDTGLSEVVELALCDLSVLRRRLQPADDGLEWRLEFPSSTEFRVQWRNGSVSSTRMGKAVGRQPMVTRVGASILCASSDRIVVLDVKQGLARQSVFELQTSPGRSLPSQLDLGWTNGARASWLLRSQSLLRIAR